MNRIVPSFGPCGLFALGLILSCGSPTGSSVQPGASTGPGGSSALAAGTVVAVGTCSKGSTVKPGFWSAGTWTELVPGTGNYGPFYPAGLAVVSGTVVVGGAPTGNAVGAQGAWTNGVWTSWKNPVGFNGPAGGSAGLVGAGGSVFAAGWAEQSGAAPLRQATVWKDGSPTLLNVTPPTGITMKASGALAIAASGTGVVIGGSYSYYDVTTTVVTIPGYWKDGAWNELTAKVPLGSQVIRCITAAGNKVYVGGYCYDSNKQAVPGYWDGPTWKDLTVTGIQGSNPFGVKALAVIGADVYALGDVSINGTFTSGLWTNGVWSTLTVPGATSTTPTCLMAVGTDLYIGGSVTLADGTSVPGYWKNSVWTALPRANGTTAGFVAGLTVVGS